MARDIIERIQRAVHIIASEIAIGSEKKKKGGPLLTQKDTDWAESVIYELATDKNLEDCFSLPGGTDELTAFFDIARAVARRAERNVVALLQKKKDKNPFILAYLNCISDILFLIPKKKAKTKVRKTKRPKKKRTR